MLFQKYKIMIIIKWELSLIIDKSRRINSLAFKITKHHVTGFLTTLKEKVYQIKVNTHEKLISKKFDLQFTEIERNQFGM